MVGRIRDIRWFAVLCPEARLRSLLCAEGSGRYFLAVRHRSAHLAPIAYLDPGWLYLLGGLALVITTILIPAIRDLDDVRFERDRALAVEQHRLDRMRRHEEYLAALDRREPALVMALAASQLNKIPEGRILILETPESYGAAASVFPFLEPPPLRLPERSHPESVLYRWTTSERARPWLLAAGGICMLMGLISRGSVRDQVEPR